MLSCAGEGIQVSSTKKLSSVGSEGVQVSGRRGSLELCAQVIFAYQGRT